MAKINCNAVTLQRLIDCFFTFSSIYLLMCFFICTFAATF